MVSSSLSDWSFLRGLELLVRGAELLVHGHDLFVRDPQLLVGALQFLDAALQVLPRRLELGLELADDRLVVLARRARHVRRAGRRRRLVDERDEEQPFHLAQSSDWLHRDPYAMPRVAPPDAGAGDHRALAVVDGLPDGAGQPCLEPGPGPRHQVLGGQTSRLAQIVVRRSSEVEDLVLSVDQHTRRDEAFNQQLQGERADPSEIRAARRRDDRRVRCRCRGGREVHDPVVSRRPEAAIDTPLPRDDFEQIHFVADRFGGPQHEMSALDQREVEQCEDLLLSRCLEVHEDVATADQVEAGEGRVRHQVLPREHHYVSQRLRDAEAVVLIDEEASQAFLRHVGDAALGIETRAREL